MREQVLLIPRPPAANILLKVTQQSEAKPLSLKLIATDHEHLYHANIKESTAKTLQANNFSGDMAEWRQILLYLLLHKRPDQASTAPIFPFKLPESLQGVEIVASSAEDDGESISLTLRKNIGGITQRLGSIKLVQDDEREEVSAFEWVETTVSEANAQRLQIGELQTATEAKDNELKRLKKELDELVEAKRQHEKLLLSKFALLLQSKKQKIRDQTILLESAQVDWALAQRIRAARDADGNGGIKREVEGSRKGKRKAGPEEIVSEDEDETVEVDEQEQDDEDEARAETPEPHEDGAASEEGGEEGDLDNAGNELSDDQYADNDEMDVEEEQQQKTSERNLPTRLQKKMDDASKESAKGKLSAGNEELEGGDEDGDETDDEL